MLSGGTFSKSSLKLFTLKCLFLDSIKSTPFNKMCLPVKRQSKAVNWGGSSKFCKVFIIQQFDVVPSAFSRSKKIDWVVIEWDQGDHEGPFLDKNAVFHWQN